MRGGIDRRRGPRPEKERRIDRLPMSAWIQRVVRSPGNRVYYAVGQKVGQAFSIGKGSL